MARTNQYPGHSRLITTINSSDNYEIIRSGPSSDDMMLISFLGTEDPEETNYTSQYSDIQGLIWTGGAEMEDLVGRAVGKGRPYDNPRSVGR